MFWDGNSLREQNKRPLEQQPEVRQCVINYKLRAAVPCGRLCRVGCCICCSYHFILVPPSLTHT